MRKYLTILFSFALISAMLVPSLISMVSDETVVTCDFSEEEEKEEHKENELEKEKIVYESFLNTPINYLFYKCATRIEVPEKYSFSVPDIHLPPPELKI